MTQRAAENLQSNGQASGLTHEAADASLASACRQAGLDATGAELIRIGSNAVYRLARPVVVRIASDASDLDGARRQVEVARWLAAEDFPAMRALDVEQPLVAEGRAVTFWESAADKTEYAPIGDVATLIRRLHDLHAPVGLQLPEKMPLGDQPLSPEEFSGLADVDAAFLVDRAEQVREGYQGLDFVLPAGVIHGDANVGNVILDQARNPVLIDLDSFAVGPRELDLIQTALFYDRLGWHTEDEYRTFVEVYGFDIMSWSGYPVLADVREVAMTLWLARKAAVDEKAAAEASKRIDAMRTGASRRDWLPF